MTVAEVTLTKRQREVLSRFIDGRSVEAIARDLALSPWTVRAHLGAIAEKLADQYPNLQPGRRVLIYGATLLAEGS